MKRQRKHLLFDIEVYPNLFMFGGLQHETGQTIVLEHSDRKQIDRDWLRVKLRQHICVGFNSMTYDAPLLFLFLGGADPIDVHRASKKIIEGGLKFWEIEKAIDSWIPSWFRENHIDLIEPQPNPFASLKVLNGRLHGRTLQDLPYDPYKPLTHEQIDRLAEYQVNDVQATQRLWEAMQQPMELRRQVSRQIGQDVRSKSDTQMGLAIIKQRAEALLKRTISKPDFRPGTSFRYSAPSFIGFENEHLRSILERIQQHDFVVRADGKTDLPKWLKDEKVVIGETAYQMGIGGLHSTESNRAVVSGNGYSLVDADVASYYPSIILSAGLYPAAIGPQFSDVYRNIRVERVEAKKKAKELKGVSGKESAYFLAHSQEQGLKIALNGTFGSFGSRYSFAYAPHLMIVVTLTGQLALLMLIERAESSGIPVVSANTDGLVFRIPENHFSGISGDRLNGGLLADITGQWEKETGFDLEFTEYSGLYSQSVNSYFAVKANGGHKRKGPWTNPWSDDPNDNDVRSQMMANPQMTICSDAALMQIKHNIPVRRTIEACCDIRQFITVIRVTKGATWNNEYLGKVVRYYWGTEGYPIYEAQPHPTTGKYKKVPKTYGCVECMTLPDEFPSDIDYERYVEEAEKILREVGYYGSLMQNTKRIRLTKARKTDILKEWVVAA